jgi:hypothetical protein
MQTPIEKSVDKLTAYLLLIGVFAPLLLLLVKHLLW